MEEWTNKYDTFEIRKYLLYRITIQLDIIRLESELDSIQFRSEDTPNAECKLMNKIKNFFVHFVIKIDKIFLKFKIQLFKIHLFNCVIFPMYIRENLYNNYFRKDHLERREIYLSRYDEYAIF